MKNKKNIFRIMYAINILGAGIPGFIIVFFPPFAEKYVLWEGQDYGVMAILGSFWLAIGLTSVLGLHRPYKFLGIFLVQFFYKTIWLSTFIFPAIINKEILPPATNILIAIFGLLILEFVLFVRPSDFRNHDNEKMKTTTNIA